MKRVIYSIVAAMILAACTADFDGREAVVEVASNDKIVNSSTDCVEGSIMVRFNPSAESRLAGCATRSGATRTGIEGVDALLDKVSGYAVEPIFVVTKENREKVYKRGLHLWYELHFDKGADIDALAEELAAVAEVKYVQFEHKVCRIGDYKPLNITSVDTRADANETTTQRRLPFNDTYGEYQWSLNNLGPNSKVQSGNYPGLQSPVTGADINVIPAWKLCKGDPSIVVAVLDEGVMYTHEDLKENIWINTSEKYGSYNVDDDENGYVDDIYGYNFVLLKDEISWDKKEKDTGHGTHVAGIISAVNQNRKGVSSIAGGSGKNDGVKIMSIQTFYGNSGASTANVAKGMQYAADNGAHIMQCSWGYESKDFSNDAAYRRSSRVEAEAIDYFVENAGTKDGPIDGGLVIFAAGNDSFARSCYPAAYKPCISVAAYTPALRPAYYTNYGPGTDIVAPGGESTYTNGAILSTVPSKFGDPTLKNYALMQGTSQACPHVSGIAALGLSYAKKLGKRYTANEFRSMLLSSTNDIDPYLKGGLKLTMSNGASLNIQYSDYKGKLGAGYIDAYKLLLNIDGTPYAVVKRGVESKIDLSTYFGTGLHHAELLSVEVSDEDKAVIGLEAEGYTYENGMLTINCANVGAATFKVTMLVGGGSTSDSTNPYPTEVSRSFVVFSKDNIPTNNGWL